MTTDFTMRRGRKKGTPSDGNPYPEIDAAKYDVSILRALDHYSWADRLGVPNNLKHDELLIEIARVAAETQALRAKMVLSRVRLIELTIYAVERVGVAKTKVSKAAGMRPQALARWLAAYHRREGSR